MEDHHYYIEKIVARYNLYFQRKLGSVPGVWKKSNEDYYCFIPSRHAMDIIDKLHRVHKYLYQSSSLKFLDCGCGIGNIILLAMSVGYISYGIEYEKETCKIAEELTFVPGDKPYKPIIHGDITTFEHYADYDVIYYFEPIKKYEKRKAFIKKLSDDVKVGAVVISYGGSTHFPNDDRFEKVLDMYGVYKKIRKSHRKVV